MKIGHLSTAQIGHVTDVRRGALCYTEGWKGCIIKARFILIILPTNVPASVSANAEAPRLLQRLSYGAQQSGPRLFVGSLLTRSESAGGASVGPQCFAVKVLSETLPSVFVVEAGDKGGEP